MLSVLSRLPREKVLDRDKGISKPGETDVVEAKVKMRVMDENPGTDAEEIWGRGGGALCYYMLHSESIHVV